MKYILLKFPQYSDEDWVLSTKAPGDKQQNQNFPEFLPTACNYL